MNSEKWKVVESLRSVGWWAQPTLRKKGVNMKLKITRKDKTAESPGMFHASVLTVYIKADRGVVGAVEAAVVSAIKAGSSDGGQVNNLKKEL